MNRYEPVTATEQEDPGSHNTAHARPRASASNSNTANALSTAGIESSWLLRLFQSEFFNTWIAVSYLFKYPENVGIQHYLCQELKRFPLDEMLFFLPQLCHLLIHLPSKVVALENLLIERCSKSPHMTILLTWYLEAYLQDLSTQTTSPALLTCRRVHDACLRILVQWHPDMSPESTPLPEEVSASFSKQDEKVQPHVDAAIVGLGCVLGAFGSTIALAPAREAVLAQGKREQTSLQGSRSSLFQGQLVDGELSPDASGLRRTFSNLGASYTSLGGSRRNSMQRSFSWLGGRRTSKASATKVVFAPPSLEDLHTGKAFSFDRYLAKARSMSVLSSAAGSPASGPSALRKVAIKAESDSEMFKHRKSMVNRHYFHSELQFVAALTDIANRLCSVPRSGRQSSLKAELALLNHNLPAQVCIPLWCQATVAKPFHHQIVRICPEEAVVLNSADRVPYLILVEVLETDESNPDGFADQELSVGSPKTKATSNMPLTSAFMESESLIDLQADVPVPAQMTDTKQPAKLQISTSLESVLIGPLSSYKHKDEYADRMRTAAVMLAQLNSSSSPVNTSTQSLIRQRIVQEMMTLEQERMNRMQTLQKEGTIAVDEVEPAVTDETKIEEENIIKSVQQSKDDPSAAVFRESFEKKSERIRSASPYGHLPSWRLLSVIVKSGADLRQEQLACQLIREMQSIWHAEHIPLYRVLVTSDSSGLIETISNSISVHSLKKDAYARNLNTPGKLFDLNDYYNITFGPRHTERFSRAQDAFMRSLAGYSLVTYILAIKDRHNGNILVDQEGHIIHIDFGFMLSNSPGSVGFESAPFKLSQDYIDILDGAQSPLFAEFRRLMITGFIALRKHADKLMLLIEMMQQNSRFPCFGNNPAATLNTLRERFQLSLTEKQIEEHIDRMLASSCNNMFTRLYDNFQYYSNGIL